MFYQKQFQFRYSYNHTWWRPDNKFFTTDLREQGEGWGERGVQERILYENWAGDKEEYGEGQEGIKKD